MPSSTLHLMKQPRAQQINQIVAAIALSFGPFSVGLGKGYTSPALASLQSTNLNQSSKFVTRPSAVFPKLTITEQEGSWIASLSLLGALFGGLFAGLLIKHGRRKTIIYMSIPLAISWALTMFASSVEMIYATACAAGFCSSVIQLATQVYLSEIAHPTIRARICSGAKIFSELGVLASFAMGAWFDWRQLAMVCAGAPLMLLITAQYVPESPSFLLYTNQEEKAVKSLQWLRGSETDISRELSTIHSNVRRMKEQGSECKKILVPQLIKPLLITSGLMLFLRFSGAFAFNYYAISIFQDIFGGSFSPHLAAVVTGGVRLLASIGSGILCDLIGRIPLLIVSSVLMCSSLAGFGAFSFYHQALGPEYVWIPLLCVMTFLCAFSIGLSPIAWLLVGEIFPLEYRSIGPSLTTAFSYVCAFVGVKTFVDLRENVGLHGTFWTYSVISFFAFLFTILFVPETRGKTLDEMEPKSGILSKKTDKKREKYGSAVYRV